MLHEVSASDGVIRSALSNAFHKDDAEAVLRLARIYRFTGIGNSDHVAAALHKDPEAKELLPIMIRLSSVPYDVDDDARALNGIASQIFDFWEVLAVSAGRIRRKLANGGCWQPSSPSNPPTCVADPVELGQLIEQQNILFDLVIRTLLAQCLLPEQLVRGVNLDHDFYQ